MKRLKEAMLLGSTVLQSMHANTGTKLYGFYVIATYASKIHSS